MSAICKKHTHPPHTTHTSKHTTPHNPPTPTPFRYDVPHLKEYWHKRNMEVFTRQEAMAMNRSITRILAPRYFMDKPLSYTDPLTPPPPPPTPSTTLPKRQLSLFIQRRPLSNTHMRARASPRQLLALPRVARPGPLWHHPPRLRLRPIRPQGGPPRPSPRRPRGPAAGGRGASLAQVQGAERGHRGGAAHGGPDAEAPPRGLRRAAPAGGDGRERRLEVKEREGGQGLLGGGREAK